MPPDKDICWRWPGTHRASDQRATVSGQFVYRLLLEASSGSPAPSVSLHHVCGNPWCINPWHLAPLDQAAHAREHGLGGDWGQAAKTHCAQGHPYDEENTYLWRGERHCRECTREAKRRYRAAKRL